MAERTVRCHVSGGVTLTLKEGEDIWEAWRRCCKALEADEAVDDTDLDIEEV